MVSVLFCDLVGFTAASEAADPEDVQARLDPYHGRVRREIERFGGSVEKFIGDAVMAVFGIPAAHEDDAERAVRTGLCILEAIEELNGADPGLDLAVRIGVNTGEALVTMKARPETSQWMVSGDVTNTASRLQSAAPVGTVAVGEVTFRQTKAVFEYEELPPVELKGKAEPVPIWRALSARARFGTDLIRMHEAPFVGREVERTLLQGLFARCARDSQTQLVTLVGEPGVGKSRLCAELFAHVDQLPELVSWRQGRCLPYGEGITFWALGEIVKAHAGIYESDSPEVAEAKLETVLYGLEERPWLRARLLPLLGIDSGQPASREESFTAWRRFLEAIAGEGPAVLVWEDLHWADPALLDFLTHLAEWTEGVPLLLLCTARPELYEKHPGWGASTRNETKINLSPLSDAETAELVSALMTRTVSGEVERAILERSGGNPLYAEEFVRLFADRGFEEDGEGVAFPDSVQALIAARLDTLSPERKSLLHDAAVVGKVFWAGALAEMGGRDPVEVEVALHDLSRKELVRPARTSSMEGESEYSFWHVLVRDVAYSQIPRAARASRHRAAAVWIEGEAGARVEDLAEVLAHHYLEAIELAQAASDSKWAAGLAAPARRFLMLAGERALGLDTAQAEAKLARALELTPAGDPQRPEMLLRWAEAAFQAGRPREAADALEQALTGFRTSGDIDGQARALMLLAEVTVALGEGRYVALAEEAVRSLELIEPSAALVAAYTTLGGVQFFSGDSAAGAATTEQAVSLAARLGLPVPARALGRRGVVRARVGDLDGLAEADRALALLMEQGGGRYAAILQNNLALARYPLEGPARSLSAFEQGIAFSEQRGLTEMAVGMGANLPGLLIELGRTEQALEHAATLAAAAEASGDTTSLSELRAVELATHLDRGDTEDATARADWLLETARELAAHELSVIALAPAAAARLAAGQPEQARVVLSELEHTAGAHETPYYARQLPAMVRTALAAGDPTLAQTLTDGLQPFFPLHQCALTSAQAQLDEAAGSYTCSTALYAEACQRWGEFGNVPERAFALLGQGRSLLALADGEAAKVPLAEARELFTSMGYKPALAETEKLLGQALAAS